MTPSDPDDRQLRPALVLAIDCAIHHAHAHGRLNISPATPLNREDYTAAYEAFLVAWSRGRVRATFPSET